MNDIGRAISSRAGVWVWAEVLPAAPFQSDVDMLEVEGESRELDQRAL